MPCLPAPPRPRGIQVTAGVFNRLRDHAEQPNGSWAAIGAGKLQGLGGEPLARARIYHSSQRVEVVLRVAGDSPGIVLGIVPGAAATRDVARTIGFPGVLDPKKRSALAAPAFSSRYAASPTASHALCVPSR
jgi:hypothetical protein